MFFVSFLDGSQARRGLRPNGDASFPPKAGNNFELAIGVAVAVLSYRRGTRRGYLAAGESTCSDRLINVAFWMRERFPTPKPLSRSIPWSLAF